MKARILALVLVFVLAISAMGASAQEGGSIVDVAAGAGSFNTLLAAAEAAGLAETLATGGPFTVFAPTDDAFAALGEDVINYLLSDTELLTSILTYHVLDGAVASTDVLGMLVDGMATAPTLNGEELTITFDGAVARINQATLDLGMIDIAADNGIIHVIDSVLLPTIELPEVLAVDFDGDINITGSSTVFPLTVNAQERFEAEGYPTGNITVDEVGTGNGFDNFCTAETAEEFEIVDASRPADEDDIANCTAIGRELIEFRVGTDALAVVVATENDFVQGATLEELALIFTAENWSDVNPEWPAEPIQRFIPDTGSGTLDYFVEEVFDEDSAPILAAPNTQRSESDNVLVEGIVGNPFAVGFFGYAYYVENQDTLRALDLEGVTPTAVTAESGEYPLSRPLFIYSDPAVLAAKPQVAAFINFYLTTVNDNIIEVGYFPASEYALNVARLRLLAYTSMAM
jgi:phosphate transport system substrate-binding protein